MQDSLSVQQAGGAPYARCACGANDRLANAVCIDGYLTKDDVIRLLKISKRTLDNWTKRKILPYIRIGRTVRFQWSEVETAFNRFKFNSIS